MVVYIIEGRYLPQSIAYCKHYCTRRVESDQLEGLVVASDDVSSQLRLCQIVQTTYRHCQIWPAADIANKTAKTTGATLLGA